MTFSVTGLPHYQKESSYIVLDEDQGSWFGMSWTSKRVMRGSRRCPVQQIALQIRRNPPFRICTNLGKLLQIDKPVPDTVSSTNFDLFSTLELDFFFWSKNPAFKIWQLCYDFCHSNSKYLALFWFFQQHFCQVFGRFFCSIRRKIMLKVPTWRIGRYSVWQFFSYSDPFLIKLPFRFIRGGINYALSWHVCT